MLFIDKYLKNNPSATCLIATPRGGVKAIFQGEFSFNVNANYNVPFLNQAQMEFSQIANQVSQSLNQMFGLSLDQVQLTHIRQTINTWTSTDNPMFAISLLFISTNKNEDSRHDPAILLENTMPDFNGTFITAPNNYKIVDAPSQPYSVSVEGTSTIQIGNFFRASGQIITNVQPMFSIQMTPNDSPLFTVVSVNFKPYRMITREELTGYFMGLTLNRQEIRGI